jgi:hypothetical protein
MAPKSKYVLEGREPFHQSHFQAPGGYHSPLLCFVCFSQVVRYLPKQNEENQNAGNATDIVVCDGT